MLGNVDCTLKAVGEVIVDVSVLSAGLSLVSIHLTDS